MFRFRSVGFALAGWLLITGSNLAVAQRIVHHSHAVVPDAAWLSNPAMTGMQFLIALWVFTLGACFGSFLNVVIYRLPEGMSLGRPKSRCPRCETPLAARDNIPVLGWLFLRGKCRYCSLPIAPRYPIVEATCGGIFLLLLFVELLTGGGNLPMCHADHIHVPTGFWLLWFMQWDLTSTYLYHCLLLILILAVAMIGYDGHQPHRGLMRFGVMAGLGFGVAWLELRPVHAINWPQSIYSFCWGVDGTESFHRIGSGLWSGVSLVGLLDGLTGLIAGWLCARVTLFQMNASPSRSADHSSTPPALLAVADCWLLVGVFLGWQACAMLCFLVLPATALFAAFAGDTTRWKSLGVLMFVIVTTFLTLWSDLDEALWFPGLLNLPGFRTADPRYFPLFTLSTVAAVAPLVRLALKRVKPCKNPDETVEKG